MNNGTLRSIFTGTIAVVAVGGGLAYALLAQQHGQSPEPPAWLALLIGGAVTYYYGQSASLNGSAQALSHFAAAVTARRAADPVAAVAASLDPQVVLMPNPPPQGSQGATQAPPSSGT